MKDSYDPLGEAAIHYDRVTQLERELAECQEKNLMLTNGSINLVGQRDQWREVASDLYGFLGVIRSGHAPQYGFGGEEFTEAVDDALEMFRKLNKNK